VQILPGEQAGVPLAGAVEPLVLLEVDDLLGDEAPVPGFEGVVGSEHPAVRLREARIAMEAVGLGNRQIDLR